MRSLNITNKITKRDEDSINKFFRDIEGYEMLSPEEETGLARRAREGEREARDKLVLHNQRFVVSVAKQYEDKNSSLPDLINEGNKGLIKAAEKYDERKGFKFITYAVWWIRQSMIRYKADSSPLIRLPYKKAQDSISNRKENEENSQKYQMDMSERFRYDYSIKSLDDRLPGSENPYMALVENRNAESPDEGLNREFLKGAIEKCLSGLPARTADIIKQHYGMEGHPKSFSTIGFEKNMTRERIRQLHNDGMMKLKRRYGNILGSYL
ncbi:MAG: sigma-70 family RNA polymerase sigma factor [Nanobdellota archaeon]